LRAHFLNLLLLFLNLHVVVLLNLHGVVLLLSPDRQRVLVGVWDQQLIFLRRSQNDYQQGLQAGSLEPS